MVANTPKSNPEAANAAGIERIPVPRDAFNKCIRVSPFDTGCSNFLALKGSNSVTAASKSFFFVILYFVVETPFVAVPS